MTNKCQCNYYYCLYFHFYLIDLSDALRQWNAQHMLVLLQNERIKDLVGKLMLKYLASVVAELQFIWWTKQCMCEMLECKCWAFSVAWFCLLLGLCTFHHIKKTLQVCYTCADLSACFVSCNLSTTLPSALCYWPSFSFDFRSHVMPNWVLPVVIFTSAFLRYLPV